MRRLFSTFAHGAPGLGLLILRLVTGITLIIRGGMRLGSGIPIYLQVMSALLIGAGILLVVGLWTPVAGALVAVIELLKILLHVGDVWIYILLGTLGAALALLGPGAWSADARLFGWKRIDFRDRQK